MTPPAADEPDPPAEPGAQAAPAPEDPRPSSEVAFARAEAHALAAASLLDDPSVPPWTAAEHLRRGFAALAQAAGLEHPPATPQDASALPWLGSPQAVGQALGALGRGDDDPTLDRAPLRLLSGALSSAVRTAQDERFAPGRRRERRRRLLRRAAITGLVLAPVVVALVLTVPDYREGPWRAQLYDNKDFEGEPIIRRDGDLKFDWKRKSPHPDIPEDAFSVRWDTCLALPEQRVVAFQLVSDDGSRLLVDGQPVVDNWGRHGERSRGAEVPMSEGVHHLRVEFYDERHSASIELRASIYGELPDSLPVRLLRYPGAEIDDDDPCAGARGS